MQTADFIPLLSLLTLLIVAGFGYYNAVATWRRKNDPNAPKSTLSSDMPDTVSGKPADT